MGAWGLASLAVAAVETRRPQVRIDPTRALVGLGGFEVIDAVERDGELVVSVRSARSEAPCPGCGVFSRRLKQNRCQRLRDGLSFERPTTLVWHKRRFRCDTPGCQATFTESTDEVPRRARVTTRLRTAIAGRPGTAPPRRSHGAIWCRGGRR